MSSDKKLKKDQSPTVSDNTTSSDGSRFALSKTHEQGAAQSESLISRAAGKVFDAVANSSMGKTVKKAANRTDEWEKREAARAAGKKTGKGG